jgi:hypothetical protein
VHVPRFLRAAMRGDLRRGITLLVCGAVLFLAAGLLLGPASDRQDRLEAEGTQVEGTVVDVSGGGRAPDSVTFRYTYDGVEHEVQIGGSNAYDIGERVTVYVDPDDPRSATLAGEQPQSGPAYVLTMVLVVASLLLLGSGVVLLFLAGRNAWRSRFGRNGWPTSHNCRYATRGRASRAGCNA